MRIIARVTNDILGLVEECEVLNASEKQMQILVGEGLAKIYDDTKPIVGKSINVYEPGKSYPPERQVFKDGGAYISNCDTSTTWVFSTAPNALSEWDVLIPINEQ